MSTIQEALGSVDDQEEFDKIWEDLSPNERRKLIDKARLGGEMEQTNKEEVDKLRTALRDAFCGTCVFCKKRDRYCEIYNPNRRNQVLFSEPKDLSVGPVCDAAQGGEKNENGTMSVDGFRVLETPETPGPIVLKQRRRESLLVTS